MLKMVELDLELIYLYDQNASNHLFHGNPDLYLEQLYET